MSGPVIGIAGAGYVVPRFWGELPVVGIPTTYVDAVVAVGGRPLILPTSHSVDLLDLVDGVVLAGGDDIGEDPARDGPRSRWWTRLRISGRRCSASAAGCSWLTVADGGSVLADLALTTSGPTSDTR